MKKIFFCFLAISFLFFSCENESNKDEELKLSIEAFKEFSNKINFTENFSIPLTSYNKNQISEILISNIKEINKFYKNGDYKIYSFIITHEGNEISFKNFKNINNKAGKGEPASDLNYKCPNGLSLINTCYSQSCVEETLANLGSNFSSGETISLYHNGLGGVKICSNVN